MKIFSTIVLPCVGLFFSSIEIVLASIVHFHMIGFGFATVGIVTSIMYLRFGRQEYMAESGRPVDDKELLNVSMTTKRLMRSQQAVEERKQKSHARGAWIGYCILMTFIVLQVFCRFFSLTMRSSWRKSLETFPDACPSWSQLHGCSRIVENVQFCVGLESDATITNAINFDTDPRTVNKAIVNCSEDLRGGKLETPDNLENLSDYQELIHLTFNSAIFGFINDMYITTYSGSLEPNQSTVINLQGQMRIGNHDYGQNMDHIKHFMKCLNNEKNLSEYANTTTHKACTI